MKIKIKPNDAKIKTKKLEKKIKTSTGWVDVVEHVAVDSKRKKPRVRIRER